MNEEEYRQFIRSLPDDAFDGHTEFHRLTPEEKLMWLSQIAQFVVEARTWRKVPKEKLQSPSDQTTQNAS
ncbi:MAG: hypothetical protein SNJ55_11300 [Chloroherpetonaceae bacterium]